MTEGHDSAGKQLAPLLKEGTVWVCGASKAFKLASVHSMAYHGMPYWLKRKASKCHLQVATISTIEAPLAQLGSFLLGVWSHLELVLFSEDYTEFTSSASLFRPTSNPTF